MYKKKWLCPLNVLELKFCVHFWSLPCVQCVPSILPSLKQSPNYICWRVQIVKWRSQACMETKIFATHNFLHHYHHHISVMELGHLLTRSGLTYPDVYSKVYHDSFCPSGSSVSLSWVIYFEAFYLHVVSSFSCVAVICQEIGVIFNSFAICAFVL